MITTPRSEEKSFSPEREVVLAFRKRFPLAAAPSLADPLGTRVEVQQCLGEYLDGGDGDTRADLAAAVGAVHDDVHRQRDRAPTLGDARRRSASVPLLNAEGSPE